MPDLEGAFRFWARREMMYEEAYTSLTEILRTMEDDREDRTKPGFKALSRAQQEVYERLEKARTNRKKAALSSEERGV